MFVRGLPALPTLCAVCHGWAIARVCDVCVRRFSAPGPRCRRCAARLPDGVDTCAVCRHEPPPFERTIAALDYAFPWDGLIAAFKFNDALERRGSLAQLLTDAVRHAAGPQPSLLLPVPLAPERLRARGYNQSWELARAVGRRLGIEASPAVLQRLVETPQQAGLPRGQRAANVRGSFGIEPRQAHRLRGMRVALVDDVMTTGATAAEAARSLRAAGAAAVDLWVLARTPAPADR